MRTLISSLLVVLAMLAGVAHAAPPTVFAAASLQPALDALAAGGDLGKPAPRLVYGSSAQLARQIEQGAPADLFISADLKWMDYIDQRHLVAAGTRVNLLGNTLVLVAPRDSTAQPDLTDRSSVMKALGDGRVAIALPDSVPAGIYGKQALQSLKLWDALRTQLAPSRDVRAALALVARKECPLGIVYGSDAVSEPRVRVAATFPADSHDAIVYPLAIVPGHDDAATRTLAAKLRGKSAGATFRHLGFTVLSASP
jgi:molybdate transport system substrate-binding protein